MTYQTHSSTETEEVGKALASSLLARGITSMFIALYGDLGVGKTAFTRGFCAELGIARVKSPTYTVVNEYRGEGVAVYHFDLYRLAGSEDLQGIGFDEYLDGDGFKLCEWSERLFEELPADYVKVTISRGEAQEQRIIQIEEHF